MNTQNFFAVTMIAIAVTLGGCSKSESPAATTDKPAAAPAASEMDHSQMHSDCDMQGMDMSNMSAAEHQAIMDKCSPSGGNSDAQAESPQHDHGDHK